MDDGLDCRSCSPVQEKMCLVVDAVERMVKLMPNDFNNSKYCLLQKLSEKQLKTFGIVLAESELEDDDYIHCDLCGVYYRASCRLHPLFIVSDREVREDNKPRAEQTLPAFFEIKTSKIPKAGLGVFAKMDIPIGLVFGPYQGRILLSDPKKADQNGYSWEIRISGKPSQYIDGSDPKYSNWMRYINSSRFENEQNLIAFQYNGSVYYRVFRPISEGIELLVWYGNKYGESLGVLSVTPRHKIPLEKNPYIFG
uniref:SET domain-containing protein n=1 Tax=Elaeophora elaphi TaxID=1147741 RepID=A0A158Q8E0_9BILA